ncbi:MAG: hypothetical protein H0T46_26735 [Deltaproteobacteria bacterium]|nr:hypothetical protein [Deltaproteobacteria bacterium]
MRARRPSARSERELGDGIVLHELELLERVIEPLVEQVERGLAMKSAARLVEYPGCARVCRCCRRMRRTCGRSGSGSTTTQHYPRDAYYQAEIVGTAMHTPIHEVRDQHANLLGTVSGTPYPVPRVVIRALATTYFVIVPAETPSHETITFE